MTEPLAGTDPEEARGPGQKFSNIPATGLNQFDFGNIGRHRAEWEVHDLKAEEVKIRWLIIVILGKVYFVLEMGRTLEDHGLKAEEVKIRWDPRGLR